MSDEEENTNPSIEDQAKEMGLSDEGNTEEETAKGPPEGIPEKFWDAEKGEVRTEALLKSYQELEKARQEQSKGSKPEIEKKSEAQETVENAGLDYNALVDEYAQRGDLSEETRKDLEKRGITRDIQDKMIEAERISQEAYWNEIRSYGGDNIDDMIQWAGDNWDTEDINAFNEAMNSRSKGQAKLAIEALKSAYERDNGSSGSPDFGGETPGSGIKPYSTMQQVAADMAKPEYKNDPDFRKKVEQRLAISEGI